MLVVGTERGWLWSREIRFFTIATVLIAFYMFGWYTPVFRAMYELMPGVKLFRRPADATFVFGALIADHGGLSGASLARRAHARERACSACIALVHRCVRSSAFTIWLAATTVGTDARAKPIVTGLASRRGASWSLLARAASDTGRAGSPRCCSALFTTADLAFNNAPHESTGLPPAVYDALRPDTRNETVALIRQRLAAQRAEPSRPRRADRHRLSLAEHLHDPRLRACVRAQSAAAEMVL